MKIVINTCFGGFSLSDFAVTALELDSRYDSISRTDARLISLIEKYGSEVCSGMFADLEVVNIPDEATDWMMQEYDGSEDILYVLDGKIYAA